MKKLVLAIALLVATAASAAPVITSITPSSGPVTGGTQVTIQGSGFNSDCPPDCHLTPSVFFGGLPAATETIVDSTTIIATTPVSFPGPVAVTRGQIDGTFGVENGFTFTGDARDAFEPLLLPIFVPVVHGAFGTTFVSTLSIWTSDPGVVPLYGLGFNPCGNFEPCIPPQFPFLFTVSGREPQQSAFSPTGDPGAVVWIRKGSFDQLAASLRVMEVTRELTTGTSIPLLRESSFRSNVFALLDLPNVAPHDPLFRSTLRVYSLDPGTSVHVRSDGNVIHADTDLTLADASDIFHPAYAQFDVPLAALRVEITPNEGHRVWAFVTITQNETQHITVIAP
ncbi:MAG TPA: IPT/TIG domain-containing protein [Thermoanaerobaculia bacterium]